MAGREPIHVVQATNALGFAGTTKTFEIFVRHLNPEIFRSSVCGLKAGGERGDAMAAAGVPVAVVHEDFPALVRRLRDWNVDVVHFHGWGGPEPMVLQAAAAAEVPAIVKTNVGLGVVDRSPEAALVDLMLFPSKTSWVLHGEQLRLRDPAALLPRHMVVYNPVELAAIDAEPPDGAQTRRALDIPDGVPVLLRVGRADDGKLDSSLADMLSLLVAGHRRVVLVIVGCTARFYRLLADRGLLGHCRFVCPTAEDRALHALYRACDVSVHAASIGESFGLVIAEAMACGKPVVTTATPRYDNAQVELVDHGRTGFVANTPRLFADAVRTLLDDPGSAAAMGAAGRRKVESLYDARVVVPSLEKLYLSVLEAKGLDLSPRVRQYAARLGVHPTPAELLDFVGEYRRRQRAAFGTQTLVERASGTLGAVRAAGATALYRTGTAAARRLRRLGATT